MSLDTSIRSPGIQIDAGTDASAMAASDVIRIGDGSALPRPGRDVCSVEVRLVRTDSGLEQAVEIRKESYGRHTPEMVPVLARPELQDFSPEAVIFVAEQVETGRVLGSIRVVTNVQTPLSFERELTLPDRFRNTQISVVQRLSLVPGSAGVEAKKSLFKAFYLYSLAMQIEWMVLYTPPPRDKLFSRLGFAPVFDGDGLIAGEFSDYRQVRLLALRVWDVEPLWRQSIPEWHDFFFRQFTPGIKIFSSVSNRAKASRPPVSINQGFQS